MKKIAALMDQMRRNSGVQPSFAAGDNTTTGGGFGKMGYCKEM
jgi:hypothetical protein